jgi:hypothetical protein
MIEEGNGDPGHAGHGEEAEVLQTPLVLAREWACAVSLHSAPSIAPAGGREQVHGFY